VPYPFGVGCPTVELVCSPAADELTVFVEIDRRGGLLSELADTDERKASFTVRETDQAAIRRQLADAIEQRA
jgi:sporulation-control protein